MIYVEHGVTKSIELSHVWSGCLGRTPQQAINSQIVSVGSGSCSLLIMPPLAKARALRDSDVLLFVCLSVRPFVRSSVASEHCYVIRYAAAPGGECGRIVSTPIQLYVKVMSRTISDAGKCFYVRIFISTTHNVLNFIP